MDENIPSITRRKAIASLGTSAVAFGALPTLTSADNGTQSEEAEFRKIIQTANKIGKNAGHNAREKFLETKGVLASEARSQGPMYSTADEGEGPKEGGVSTQNFKCIEPQKPCDLDVDGQIDCTLTLNEYTDYATYRYFAATFGVRYYYRWPNYSGTGIDGPATPKDALGIQWAPGHWKARDQDFFDSVEQDTYVKWDNGSQIGDDGSGWLVEEVPLCKEDGYTGGASTQNYEWSHREYATVYVEPGPEFESNNDRSRITGSYCHTWSVGTVDGVGVSFPRGITLSASLGTDSEDLATDLSVDDLEVYMRDA